MLAFRPAVARLLEGMIPSIRAPEKDVALTYLRIFRGYGDVGCGHDPVGDLVTNPCNAIQNSSVALTDAISLDGTSNTFAKT
jgi:hypothetical protein